MIDPDYDASVEFLRLWRRDGPWVLVSIDPEKRALDCATFTLAQLKELRAWIEHQGSSLARNVYFTVNSCVRAATKKPTREMIASLDWLHVDVDPRVGEDLHEERERILALVTDPGPLGLPKPSIIVDSGGGYQAFWRLKVPHLLDGSPEEYEEAKRWNKQLEILFGGDNCHNVDRIMRLPGTVNRPDPKKRAKGRVEALARLVSVTPETHNLKTFTKAPLVQGREAPGFSGRTVEVSGNVARLSSVDELPEGVSDKAKVVIVQGHDPDEPNRFPGSRSEWLFFACCEMVRGGCSDDVIYSVITDPDFGISESVLDKGPGSDRYALRQIERAREEAIDPVLRDFNDRHAVIGSIGSKGLCRILSEEEDPVTGRTKIAFQNQADFALRYRKRKVEWTNREGKPVEMPAALWWLEHPQGRYFDTIVFAPGMETPGAYNLWKGFAYSANPSGSCELYLRHLFDHICAEDAEVYEYVLNWMARAVQEPATPGQVAIVMRGDQGAGKGVFAGHFGRLFGRHYLHVTDSKHLVGSFNAHMRDCVMMFADEAFASNDKRAESMLKTLVTESMIVTEAKGVDAEPTPNFIHLLLASNNRWVIPAGPHERRFLMLSVRASRRQDSRYFAAIEHEMESGGYEALLAMLLSRDLSDFDIRRAPRTDALRDQQEHSLSAEEEWWYAKLQDGELRTGEGWPDSVWAEELLCDYTDHLKANRGTRSSSIRLRRFLEEVTGRLVEKVQVKLANPVVITDRNGIGREMTRPYAFRLPTLEKCREIWEGMGNPAKWDERPEVEDLPYEEYQ